MNCSTFKKRLEDYLEDNLHNDMKDAMDNHIEECPSCKKIYEEEIAIESMFKAALAIEGSTFNSSRSHIIKSIDKQKYSRNLLVKLKYHFFKYNRRYISAAAALFIALAMPGHFSKLFYKSNDANKLANNTSLQRVEANVKQQNENVDIKNKQSTNVKSEEGKKIDIPTKDMELVELSGYVPSFTKTEVKFTLEPEFATKWKASVDNRFNACIEGKGPEASEEGIGDVIVKDNQLKKAWKFSILNKNTQDTPKYLEWADNNNLFIIVGLAHGTVSQGGNVYALNIDNGKSTLVYETQSSKEQVKSLANKNNSLDLNLVVYDNNMNNYHEEMKIIKYENVIREFSEPVNLVKNLIEDINSKNYTEAEKKFYYTDSSFNEKYLGDLNAINSMKINKIIDITDTSLFKINNFYDFKAYALEIDYSIDKSKQSNLKDGVIYQRFIVAKEDKTSLWKIVHVLTPPQN
ncbi:DUF4652 domain-containing protein [Desnuesiella massiliensis]|uniref:DUF4652 domain-containing protein n=1 Tax=Desnuesiella massiliensis TaxID=1650662 RepID=UPI0006E2BB11|nr:DUF4652 domain-containing protein [Desnuesiella massiliensis]